MNYEIFYEEIYSFCWLRNSKNVIDKKNLLSIIVRRVFLPATDGCCSLKLIGVAFATVSLTHAIAPLIRNHKAPDGTLNNRMHSEALKNSREMGQIRCNVVSCARSRDNDMYQKVNNRVEFVPISFMNYESLQRRTIHNVVPRPRSLPSAHGGGGRRADWYAILNHDLPSAGRLEFISVRVATIRIMLRCRGRFFPAITE